MINRNTKILIDWQPLAGELDFNHLWLWDSMSQCKMRLHLLYILTVFLSFFLLLLLSRSPQPYSPFISAEGRPLPDGALHAALGAHHADQRQRVRWGRLLLSALHWHHPPPGGNALRPGAARDTCGGGEGGSGGGWRGGAQLRVATQQAGHHTALDPQRPGDTR